MIVILAGLAAFAIAALLAAMQLIPTFGARHRKPLHVQAREFAADLWAAAAKVNGLRTEKLSDEDKATEVWVDGLQAGDDPEPPAGGKPHGPAAPARRPQVLTVARVRAAAVLRALPLDAVPHLRKGQYQDATGTFAAIAAEPPALHADESFSLTQDEVTAGLAQHAEEWGQ